MTAFLAKDTKSIQRSQLVLFDAKDNLTYVTLGYE